MAEQSASELFRQAVNAAQARDIPRARQLIQASIRKDPTNHMAWLILASVAETKRNQLISLKKVLELDPSNKQALKMVRDLGVDPAQLMGATPTDSGRLRQPEERTTPEPEPEQPQDKPTVSEAVTEEPGGEVVGAPAFAGVPVKEEVPLAPQDVPIPEPEPRPKTFEDRVVLYATQSRDLADEAMKIPPPPDGVQWVKKSENRAGENEILLVRSAAATAIITGVIVPLIIIGGVLWNVPAVRVLVLRPTPTRFLSLQEPTGTPTPLTTPTITPGFTPTASATPDTEVAVDVTPTITPTQPFPPGDPYRFEPTDIFLPGSSGGRAEEDAAQLIAQGVYAPAIETVQAERANLGEQAFNANLYHQEARALIAQGEAQAALDLMEEAEDRRQALAPNNPSFIAALSAGRAEANLALGRAALENGNPGGASQFFSRVQTEANEAIRNEPDWAEPYLMLIERYILGQQYQQALGVIADALAQPSLTDDLRFYLLEAEVDYAQGRLDEALTGAETVLFADPASARAHDLRTQIAIDQENYSLASLYVQAYLNFHPRTLDAWVAFGNIRLAEGNPSLAIEAFTRAIEVGENTDLTVPIEAYLARADIYEARGQAGLALGDVRAAADLTPEDEVADLREREMELAYQAGDYERARVLLGALRENGGTATGITNYMEARLILTQEALIQEDWEQVTTLIDGGIGGIPQAAQADANAIRARGYYELGNYDVALNFINSALQQEQRLSWYLLRADVYEGQASFEAAVLEYKRVLALAAVLPADTPDLVTEAQAGITRNRDNMLVASATATAEAAQ